MKKTISRVALFALIAMAASSNVFSQTQHTLSLKPNASIGEDANIFTRVGSNDANTNFGTFPEINMSTWTWGGYQGTLRSLLRFSQLSNIPSNATIISAELRLYGLQTSVISGYNDSYYPGSTFPTNPLYIQQVTSQWNENNVTWNTQPTTTTQNQISAPASTSQNNYNYFTNSPNLVAMVQNMVSNPTSNYGFMIKLQTEQTYRSFNFASSDHSDLKLWPELIITYEVCDAAFNYCANSSTNEFYFDSYENYGNHTWTINGDATSYDQGFNYQFPQFGSYEVCHTTVLNGDTCTSCINLCLGDSIFNKAMKQEEIYSNDVPTGTIPAMDIINNDINIYPNPASKNWNVEMNNKNDKNVNLILKDNLGNTVYSKNKDLTKGKNTIVIENSSFESGIYILEITSNGNKTSHKLIKN